MSIHLMHALTPARHTLRQQLHALLSVFMASREIGERLRQEDAGMIESMNVEGAEDASVRQLLLAIAVNIRVLDDQTGLSQDLFVGDCGTLLEDSAEFATAVALSLRVACNKLIHAELVSFERTALTSNINCLSPYLHLRGKNQAGTKSWRASISVYEFVRAGLVATHRYAPVAA